MIRRRLVLISLVCLLMTTLSTWAADIPLPADSIYQLEIPLTNQDGKPANLIDHRGKPLLISMFYTGCQFVCPRIIDALKKTEGALTPAERKNTAVLMVTFDPGHDDIAALKAVTVERNLDGAQWTLARTDDRNVRKLAAALGIHYRALPSGDFNHTSVLILLDGEGRIVAKTSTIGEADEEFVNHTRKVVKQKFHLGRQLNSH
jgi:protein SCO1